MRPISAEEVVQSAIALIGYAALKAGAYPDGGGVAEGGWILFDHGFELRTTHGLPIDICAEECHKYGFRFNFWQYYKDARVADWKHERIVSSVFEGGNSIYNRIYGEGEADKIRGLLEAAGEYWDDRATRTIGDKTVRYTWAEAVPQADEELTLFAAGRAAVLRAKLEES